MYRKDKDANGKTRFNETDKIYVVLSFTSKMSLFWITVGALMSNITEGEEKDGWMNVIIAAGVAPACLALLYMAPIWYRQFPSSTANNIMNRAQKQVAKLVF